MDITVGEIIAAALDRQPLAVGYTVTHALHEMYPRSTVLEGNMGSFNFEAFAAEGLCTATELPKPQPERLTVVMLPDGVQVSRPMQALFDVTWEGHALVVLVMHYPEYHYWILSDDAEVGNTFHIEVCRWNTRSPDEYILVFDVGGWNRDETLLAAIAGATLNNLVLRGTMKEEILADIQDFFASEALYGRFRVPWKRGILFLGPPGNGKTHAVKALVNAIGQRCVYVKTFHAGMPDIFGIRTVFDQARAVAPCVLVFEDLDSLLTPENRSYFLNELDGFAGNHGILTLATTNHPERLDPAILDRPSRFDRKYPFDLPERAERRVYIKQWNQSLETELQLTEDGLELVVEATEEFSFAYLKELFLAATMRWIRDQQEGTMNGIMLEQAEKLREQMATVGGGVPEPYYPAAGPMHRAHGPRRGGPGMVQRPEDVPL